MFRASMRRWSGLWLLVVSWSSLLILKVTSGWVRLVIRQVLSWASGSKRRGDRSELDLEVNQSHPMAEAVKNNQIPPASAAWSLIFSLGWYQDKLEDTTSFSSVESQFFARLGPREME